MAKSKENKMRRLGCDEGVSHIKMPSKTRAMPYTIPCTNQWIIYFNHYLLHIVIAVVTVVSGGNFVPQACTRNHFRQKFPLPTLYQATKGYAL